MVNVGSSWMYAHNISNSIFFAYIGLQIGLFRLADGVSE